MSRSNAAARILALTGLLMGFTAVNALAAPVLCTSAPNLATLITDGSCQYLDKVFSNFALNFLGGHTSGSVATPTVPPANTVLASFSNSGSFTNGIPSSVALTFSFSANNTISDFQTLELAIQYQVDIATGSPANMTGVSGNTVAALSNSGTANSIIALKDSCAGSGYIYGGLASAPTDSCPQPPALEDDLVYRVTSWTKGSGLSLHVTRGGTTSFSAPVTEVGAYDDVSLSGGTGTVSPTQTAGIFSVSNTFNEQYAPPPSVPEPGTLFLIGGALLGLSAFVRRKRAA